MTATEQVQLIPLAKLHISENNTRQPKPTDPTIKELAKSLKAEQKTPILVRPHPEKKGHYEIAAGARRYTAALAAELKTLKAIVREYDDDSFEETILTENLQRLDPDPYAEAILLKRLIDRGQTNIKHIAASLGKSEKWASRRYQLASLPESLLKAWGPKGNLHHFSAEMMELLAALPNLPHEDEDFLHQIQRATSRKDLESRVSPFLAPLTDAEWLNDACTFVAGCGPGCACDSSKQNTLFENKDDACARCLNPACFLARRQLHINAEYTRLCEGESLPVFAQEPVTIQGTRYERDYNIWSHDFTTTPSEGAKKVVLFKYGKLHVAYIPEKKKSAKDKDGIPATPEEKLKAKTSMLQGKRWGLVREKLEAALTAAPYEKLTAPIDHLIAVFGLPFKVESLQSAPADEGLWDYIHKPTAFPIRDNTEEDRYGYKHMRFGFTGEDAQREHALWPSVKQILLGLIPKPARVSDADKFETTYREVSTLIGFPIEEEKKAADLEILPPKSWGKVDPHTLQPIDK
jgi:ParB/RepB/Spo0J family partition protein